MAYADLHMHSTYSDGKYDPCTIIDIAAKQDGLNAISITDHDCFDAFIRADTHAKARGIDLINGAEITATYKDKPVHILAYFADFSYTPLQDLVLSNKNTRKTRTLAIAERLEDAGIPIFDFLPSDVDACINRPLLAHVLLDNGFVETTSEAFLKYLGMSSPFYIDAVYPDAVEVIRLIQEANGYAFLAHPARSKAVDLVPSLSKEGLHGIEVFHCRHTLAQSDELNTLARDHGLAVSGGSDWHGDDSHASDPGQFGLSEQLYHQFLRLCDRE